jgi:hypothetical protein
VSNSENLLATFGAPYWGFSKPAGSIYARQKWFSPQWLYVIASGRDDRPVKIGISMDIAERIKQFEAGNPYGLRSVHATRLCQGTAWQVERLLHGHFSAQALGREWFEVSAEDVAPVADALAARAVAAARRYYREQITAEHRAAKAAAREARRRSEAYREAEAVARAKRRQDAAAKAHSIASYRHLQGIGPPPLPLGVVIGGDGRKAKLDRYKARRGL